MYITTIAAILSAALVNIAVSCDSERIYFGSINEAHADQVEYNGIYVKGNVEHDGHPLYKHESRDLYIYHVSGTLLSSSFWVVGTDPGNLSVSVIVPTQAETPATAREYWTILEGDQWVPQRGLRAECVDDAFVTCMTGKVRLHGLSAFNSHQRNLTGVYHMMLRTNENRPVYRRIHHGDVDYLFYVRGLWMVGPEIGRVSAGLFVSDYAWRPEYIIESWIVFTGNRFRRDNKLRVTCFDGQVDPYVVPSEEEDNDNTGIINVEPGSLPHGELDETNLPICNDSFCLNGGTCIQNEAGFKMCACLEGFEGLACQIATSCGDPPTLINGHAISEMGHRNHDMVFYACDEDYQLIGDSASTCGENGLWSAPPLCVHWLDYLSPGIPAPMSPPGRRHFMSPRHRRRFRSRRNGRSVESGKLIKPFL